MLNFDTLTTLPLEINHRLKMIDRTVSDKVRQIESDQFLPQIVLEAQHCGDVLGMEVV